MTTWLLTAIHQISFVIDVFTHTVVGKFVYATTISVFQTTVYTSNSGTELVSTEPTSSRIRKPISTCIGSRVSASFLKNNPCQLYPTTLGQLHCTQTAQGSVTTLYPNSPQAVQTLLPYILGNPTTPGSSGTMYPNCPHQLKGVDPAS